MPANEYSMDDLKAWAGVKNGAGSAGADQAPEKVVAGDPVDGDEPLPGEDDADAGAGTTPQDYMKQAAAAIKECVDDLKEVGVLKASKGVQARFASVLQEIEDAAKELENVASKYEMDSAGADPLDDDEDLGDDEDADPDADPDAEEGDDEDGPPSDDEDDSDDDEEDPKKKGLPPKKKKAPGANPFGKK